MSGELDCEWSRWPGSIHIQYLITNNTVQTSHTNHRGTLLVYMVIDARTQSPNTCIPLTLFTTILPVIYHTHKHVYTIVIYHTYGLPFELGCFLLSRTKPFKFKHLKLAPKANANAQEDNLKLEANSLRWFC